MVRKLVFALSLVLTPMVASVSHAQQQVEKYGTGWIVNDPSMPPILISPQGNGRYTLVTPTVPGQPTTTISPFGSGFIVNTPGKPSKTIMPLGSGWIVNKAQP